MSKKYKIKPNLELELMIQEVKQAEQIKHSMIIFMNQLDKDMEPKRKRIYKELKIII